MAMRAKKAANAERLWTAGFILGTLANLLLTMNNYGLLVAMADYTMASFGATAAEAGLCAGMFAIGALVSRLVSGRIIDAVGRKRLLVIGAVLEVVFSSLYLVVGSMIPFYGLRVCHGFAYGVCSTALSTIATSLVPRSRRGEGIGYYMLSVTVGAALGPSMGLMVSQQIGFQALFVVCAAISAGCLLFSALIRMPKGALEQEAAAVNAAGTVRANAAAKPKRTAKEVICEFIEPAALPIALVCALLFLCNSSLLTFLSAFAAENDLTGPAGVFFIVHSLANFVTRPLTGKMFDRKGDRVVMIPSFVSFIVGMVLLSRADSALTMLIAAAFLGFGVGTIQSCGLSVAVRETPDEHLALANSTFNLLLDAGVGIGPTILGAILPYSGYRGLYFLMGVATIVITALYLVFSRKSASKKAA